MSRHHPDIRAIMALGSLGPQAEAPGEPPPGALAAIETALYRQLYIRPQEQAGAASNQTEKRDFIHALSEANTGKGTWENGWHVVERGGAGRSGADWIVRRGALRFWAPGSGVRGGGDAVGAGHPCAVLIGKEMRHLVPGFYMALGDLDSHRAPETDNEQPIVRVYWHLRAGGSVAYVAAATAALNDARLPFRTKVVSDPAGYMRADAGVLYLLREDYRRAAPLLLDIHARISPWLRPTVPMFTKPLRDGMGLAENPVDGLSFGQSRCRLAAAALWICHRGGIIDADERSEVYAEVARAAGLNPCLPYLEPGSEDVYAL